MEESAADLMNPEQMLALLMTIADLRLQVARQFEEIRVMREELDLLRAYAPGPANGAGGSRSTMTDRVTNGAPLGAD